MNSGYIKLWRCVKDNPLWFEEPFTRGQAWVDLLMVANHKPGTIRRRGIRVNVNRGEVGMSLRELAERWRWSLGKVQRFFEELKTDTQIHYRTDTENVNVTNLICITNYEKYQSCNTETGTEISTETGTETIRKRVQNKNEKNEKNKSKEESKRFMPPTIFEVKGYMDEIGYKGNPQKFVDHYTANGWYVGKNKMKDWKAAVRTWRGNDNDRSGNYDGSAQVGAKTAGSENNHPSKTGIGVKDFACGFPDRSGEW